MKRKIPQNTNVFEYVNMNPKNKNTQDCAVRAIALIMRKTWNTVYKDLCVLGLKLGFMPNDKRTIIKYIESCGYVKQSQPKDKDGKRMNAATFVNTFNGECIARIGSSHLSAIKNNKVHDSWDCSDRIMNVYFIKK